jgi:MraZ protein
MKRPKESDGKDFFRGRFKATVDPKGRLKIPVGFRDDLLKKYGRRVFVTSLTRKNILIFPFAIWNSWENAMTSEESPTKKVVRKFRRRANYYGQVQEVDSQGRVLVPSPLREETKINGEVDVIGELTYLAVYNAGVLKDELDREEWTDDDWDSLPKVVM